MAGNSVIGSLRVDLGLNSAQFTKGMKDASSGLKVFGVQLTYSLNGIAYQLGRLIGAFPTAIKGAIDHADALNKSAQKAGVTVEALSRLEYAAKLSDISLEQLTGGLGKLSRAMADATITKTSTAATAFKALGISVTDAAGKLRSSSAVLGEIADRFARLPDGATKTALALQIFGKSGADLIPLLNQGSKGIAEMSAEADRLGITISGKTASAAERFNDTLTKIGAIMDGVVNQVMQAALPALQSFADLLASPDFASAAKQLATWIVQAMNSIVSAVVGATNALSDLFNKVGGRAGSGAAGAGVDDIKQQIADWQSFIRQRTDGFGGILFDRQGVGRAQNEIAALRAELSARATGTTTLGGSAFRGGFGSAAFSGGGGGGVTPPAFDVPEFSSATKALKDWNDEVDGTIKRNQMVAESIGNTLTSAFTGFIDAIRQGKGPLEAFGDQLANIGQQLLNQGIASLISSIFTPNFIGGTLGAPALKLGFQTGIPGFADGTMSAPAGMAWVGERGPELVNFRGGEQVIPNGGVGGQSTVRISLDQGLVASILEQSKNQSIQIVKTGAPAAVAAAQRNRTK